MRLRAIALRRRQFLLLSEWIWTIVSRVRLKSHSQSLNFLNLSFSLSLSSIGHSFGGFLFSFFFFFFSVHAHSAVRLPNKTNEDIVVEINSKSTKIPFICFASFTGKCYSQLAISTIDNHFDLPWLKPSDWVAG